MNEYFEVEIEIVDFEDEDVVTASDCQIETEQVCLVGLEG